MAEKKTTKKSKAKLASKASNVLHEVLLSDVLSPQDVSLVEKAIRSVYDANGGLHESLSASEADSENERLRLELTIVDDMLHNANLKISYREREIVDFKDRITELTAQLESFERECINLRIANCELMKPKGVNKLFKMLGWVP